MNLELSRTPAPMLPSTGVRRRLRRVRPAYFLVAGWLLAACTAAPPARPPAESTPPEAGRSDAAAAQDQAEAQSQVAGQAEQKDQAGEQSAAGEIQEDPGQPDRADGEATGEEEATVAAAQQELVPPDGRWLKDEEGKEYFLKEIPRREGFYKLLPDNRVIAPPGAVYHLAEVREDVLLVKIFRPRAREETEPKGPSAEELAAIRASYEPELPEADRLRVVPFDQGLPRSGQWREGFDVVDIDGDGHLDIVHGPPRKGTGTPMIFLGDGRGSWRRWQTRFSGKTLDYGDVAVADFNGDGHEDVAFAVHLRGVAVMVGDGEGSFRPWGEGLEYWDGAGGAPPDFSTRTVAAVDWNGDGRPDLLTVGEGPRLARQGSRRKPEFSRGAQGPVLFLNQGDGTWVRYDQGTGRDQVFGDDVAMGDFDGDGRLDFATASSALGNRAILYFGRADGGWEHRQLELARPGIVHSVEAADFDGDGRPELVVGYASIERLPEPVWFTGVDLFRLESDGSWRRRPLASLAETKEGVTALASGDLDGDGHRDLAALTGDGHTWLFLGTEGGGLVREQSPELAPLDWGCRGSAAAFADVDGDGRDELVLAFAGETGSEIIFPGRQPRCPSSGSLQVWKAGAP